MAITSTRHMTFLDPARAIELAAVQRALEGLCLREASEAVEDGRVVAADTGHSYRWQPVPMVIAFREELKQELKTQFSRPPKFSAPEFRLKPFKTSPALPP